MLSTFLRIAIVLTIAIGGGAGSVWWALAGWQGPGALEIGGWTAWPAAGTPQADPYARARIARDATLPLGRAEGLAFEARRDSAGEPLRRDCAYRMEGKVPVARFWTLHWAPPGRPPAERLPALHSLQILRGADNSFDAAVGPFAAPGNWLRTEGKGDMVLLLTFYDIPVSSGLDASDLDMPRIYRTGCDA